MGRLRLYLIILLAVALAFSTLPTMGYGATTGYLTRLITPGVLGGGASGYSYFPSISADGMKVAFWSSTPDVIAASAGNTRDQIYLYDVATDTTILVSKDANGAPANQFSLQPAISADGSRIAFLSNSTNLAGAETTTDGYSTQIFLYDIASDTITLVTKGASGTGSNGNAESPAISEDGNYIAFRCNANDLVGAETEQDYQHDNIFRYDVSTDSTIRITQGVGGASANYSSLSPSISGDGSVVAYCSTATNLAGAQTNAGYNSQIFVYDVPTNKTTLVTATATGVGSWAASYDPRLTTDGSKMVFVSAAMDLVGAPTTVYGRFNIFEYTIASATTKLITPQTMNGTCALAPAISGDGSSIWFTCTASNLPGAPTAAPGTYNLFRTDGSGTFTLISAGVAGQGGNGDCWQVSPSYDGSIASFSSLASDLLGAPTLRGPFQVFYWSNAIVTFDMVTFDPQNSNSPWSVPAIIGNPINQPLPPQKPGFYFAGWWTDPTGGTQWNFTDPVQDAMTLYAHWSDTPLLVTVTFDLQNSTPLQVMYNVLVGSHIKFPNLPVKPGYTFAGWWTDPVAGTQWIFSVDRVTGDMTLYAHWTENQLQTATVTFDGQNATPLLVIGDVALDSLLTRPSNPTKAGYTFAGWWTDPVGGTQWNFALDRVTGDMTLFAHWQKNDPGGPETPEKPEEPGTPQPPATGDEDIYYLIAIGAAAFALGAFIVMWVLRMNRRAHGFVVDDVMSPRHEEEVEKALDVTFDELVDDIEHLDLE